jgi:hypothetical protein
VLDVGRVYMAQVAGQLMLAAIVIVALYAFHRHYRRRYLLYWAHSWLALGTYIGAAALSPGVAALGAGARGPLLGLALA